MAKFNGNIFNRALGSIGGNTFSQARYRGGKVQTGRQRVAPANPQTPSQQTVRTNFRDSILISSLIRGEDIYPAFDYAVSKLPAFQSITSIFQHVKRLQNGQIIAFKEYPTVAKSNLQGQRITFAQGDQSGVWQVNTQQGQGSIAHPDDLVWILGIGSPISSSVTPTRRVGFETAQRQFATTITADFSTVDGATQNVLFLSVTENRSASASNRYSAISFFLSSQH